MVRGFNSSDEASAGSAPVWTDIQLFLLGIALSCFPLVMIVLAESHYKNFISLWIIAYRYELAYGGFCGIVLVAYEHYRSLHKLTFFFFVIFACLTFLVAVSLMVFNNQPTHYVVKEVFHDADTVGYFNMAAKLCAPLFAFDVALGIAIISAHRIFGVSHVHVKELDRKGRGGAPRTAGTRHRRTAAP